jgi:sigma-E factor negative regulatory protein RseC
MALETGRVIDTGNGQAVVEVQKGADCAQCHAGCACHFGEKTVMVRVDDPIGVDKDQIVSVAIPQGNVLLAAFVVYIIPLIALIVGILVGDYLGKRFEIELLFEVLGAVVGIALSVPAIRYYDRIFKRHFKERPRITNIIRHNPA